MAEVPNNQPEIKTPEANDPSLEGKVAQVERSYKVPINVPVFLRKGLANVGNVLEN